MDNLLYFICITLFITGGKISISKNTYIQTKGLISELTILIVAIICLRKK